MLEANRRVYVRVSTHMSVFIYRYNIYIYIYIHIYIYIYVSLYVCIIYIYIYMHMPTDTHKLSGNTKSTYQRISNGQFGVGLGLHSLADPYYPIILI